MTLFFKNKLPKNPGTLVYLFTSKDQDLAVVTFTEIYSLDVIDKYHWVVWDSSIGKEIACPQGVPKASNSSQTLAKRI